MEWPRELRYRRIEEVAECEITDLKIESMLVLIVKRFIFNLQQDY